MVDRGQTREDEGERILEVGSRKAEGEKDRSAEDESINSREARRLEGQEAKE